jgi:hypothetical protein
MMSSICGDCGAEVKIGDWPWCPHDKDVRGGWHFSHGPQWTPRKEHLAVERARSPFAETLPSETD